MTHTTTHIPQGYKQTPVGIIPEDWEFDEMKNLSNVNQGLQIPISERKTEQTEKSHFYITNEFLKKDSKNKYYIENPPQSVICSKNDILMTRTGNTGLVVTDVEGVFHNNFFKIDYNKEKLNKTFLYVYLRMPKTQYKIMALAGNSTIPDLNHSDFYKIKLPIPPLAEQEKIADCLTTWDKAIEKITALIEAKKQYKKGLMQQLLTGKKRLDGFTEEWKEVRLGEVLNHKTKLVEGKDYEPVSVGVLGIRLRSSIYSKELSNDYSKNKVFEPRQLCFGIGTNEIVFGINKSCNIYCVSPAYKVFDIRGINEHFLEGLLRVINNMLSCKYMIVGARQGKSVEFSALLNHKIKIPSLEEQTAIAEILSAADREISLLEKKKTHIETQKRGLMQVLLTGKKRLV
ncbi:restriction endonuclease subunit S [Ornithobacterium rhinotracheale]|uniref:restriction endonuclease subunit S n=1 Tax=Ornithobacterium rhinotracheale TaxID=28251 RepID=UPI004036B03B